ncbi:hypothetical protein [Luteococcus peritonei]|uniref:DUF1871 family protein n=1 Tax=Luteococcus peritonei TaxID=88874 RepID=A0ABW4RTZ8_9ACTN
MRELHDPLELELRRLLLEWDPIGVIPGAPEDEYDCMIPALRSMVEREVGSDEIHGYLVWELREHFGLTPNEATGVVAGQIAALATGRPPVG